MLRLLCSISLIASFGTARAANAPSTAQSSTLPAIKSSTEPSPAATTTASFAGTFSDGRLTVVLGVAAAEKAKAGTYVGTFTLDGKTYDCVASPKRIDGADGLAGTFKVGGNPFQFTAVFEGGGLLLHSADLSYHLKNITPPAAVPATIPATLPPT